jgi:uncharacterized membrane protein YphA (DoxX/SURF4 family)
LVLPACRLGMGGLFLVAGVLKLAAPMEFVESVGAYEILPHRLDAAAALLVIYLELLIGLGLLVGILARGAAALVAALSVGFAVAVGSAVLRGLEIDCGCLGPRGSQVSVGHVAFNIAVAGLAALVVVYGPGRWSLDSWLPGLSSGVARPTEKQTDLAVR